jgi:hypothetical protein
MLRHELYKEIQIFRTRPDPPPILEHFFATREQLDREIALLKERAPDVAEQAGRSSTGGTRQGLARPLSNQSLT